MCSKAQVHSKIHAGGSALYTLVVEYMQVVVHWVVKCVLALNVEMGMCCCSSVEPASSSRVCSSNTWV